MEFGFYKLKYIYIWVIPRQCKDVLIFLIDDRQADPISYMLATQKFTYSCMDIDLKCDFCLFKNKSDYVHETHFKL